MGAVILSPQRLSPQSAKGDVSRKTSCVVPGPEIRVLIAHLKRASAFPQVVVTETETREIDLGALNAQLAAYGQGIPPEVRADFTEKNKSACAIKPFAGVPNLQFISERENNLMFKPDVVTGWRQFHKKYGKNAEILWLSRVGFNPARTLALFHVSARAGPLVGSGFLFVFERKNGKWVLKTHIQTWIS